MALRAIRLAAAAGDQIVITVEDTGIGIPREAFASLFSEFNEASAATTKSFGGTGLGLAVSHKLARLLHGDIRVESEPGRGSVFTVRLPAAFPELAAAA